MPAAPACRSAGVALLLLAGWPVPLRAQNEAAPAIVRTDVPPPPANDGWVLTLGVAPVLSPAWQGSNDVALSLYPDVRVSYRDIVSVSVPEGLVWNVVREGGWRAGPVAAIRFGRREERGGSPFLITGGSDDLRGLGDVNLAGEFGMFAEKQFGERRWRARAEVRRGVGGHEGVLADFSIAYRGRASRLSYSIGPRLTVASASFMRTYFGIDPAQSQRSGLAQYNPAGGLLSVGAGVSAVRVLNRSSAITLFGGLDYLGPEPADSPLIRERGRRVQGSLGIAYGYRFNL